jgi:hypothetical protein
VPRSDDVGDWGNKDHEDSVRIIHCALDAGINFIDTADIYSQGESEVLVGKALAGGRRDDVVLATKAWGPMGDDPNQRGVSRRWIIREVENSLKRLGTDWIDLYQIHRYESDVAPVPTGGDPQVTRDSLRKGGDSNSRDGGCPPAGFQDQAILALKCGKLTARATTRASPRQRDGRAARDNRLRDQGVAVAGSP